MCGAGGIEGRHRAAVRYALSIPQPALGVRHAARDDTARNALSARIGASGGELERAAAARKASPHRPGLVPPGGAQQRSKSFDRSRLVFVAASGKRRDTRQPATRGSRRGRSRFATTERRYSFWGRAERFLRYRGADREPGSRHRGRYQRRPSRRCAGETSLDTAAIRPRLALAARSRRQPVVPDGAAVSAGRQPSMGRRFWPPARRFGRLFAPALTAALL